VNAETDRWELRDHGRGSANPVVMHEAISAEGWLLQQRREPVGEDTGMNEQHRLTVSLNLELKCNVVY
jgi:hypothetical protein